MDEPTVSGLFGFYFVRPTGVIAVITDCENLCVVFRDNDCAYLKSWIA